MQFEAVFLCFLRMKTEMNRLNSQIFHKFFFRIIYISLYINLDLTTAIMWQIFSSLHSRGLDYTRLSTHTVDKKLRLLLIFKLQICP